MQTSYFYKSSKLPNVVSIANSCPTYFHGKIFKALIPPFKLVDDYKKGNINESQYINQYENLILRDLNPIKIYNQLGDNAVLLCWERKNVFCHRRIVADWFERNLDIKVPEI